MAKKLKLQNVIDRCNDIFDNKYDYSQSVFVNTRTPMDIICPIHGKFSMPPKRHLNGQGCPECGKEYARNWRKGNWKHFVNRLNELYPNQFTTPNIENLYENEKSVVDVVCKNCGYTYHLSSNYFLSDKFNGCKECKFYYTFEELSSKNMTDNEMVYFEGKKDYRTDKVKLICEEHGEYDVSVSTILQGKGKCSKCNGHSRLLTQEEAFKRLKEKYGDSIIPLTSYIKSNIPITFQCSNGHTFERTFGGAMYTKLYSPCPFCTKIDLSKKRTKTKDEFIEDAIKVYGKDKYDFTESEYINSSNSITIKCNECGRYFTIEANSFLQGHGCPYHNYTSSIMEKELATLIKSYGYVCLTNCRNILPSGKELDIYIPQLKIAFEFDGLYWHNELNKDSNYHLNKTIECEAQGIRLFHIFEDEWINKKDIIISIINNLFCHDQIKIHARKCTINEIDEKTANTFLKENHLQGVCGSTFKYGLIYKNELISLMTFGPSRHFIGNNSHQFELLRFCTKKGVIVNGGASKLFKYFITKHNPSSVVSYADRRWSQGKLYYKLGFKLYNKSKPNYFYVIGNERKNRFLYRKSELIRKYNCPNEISEHDFCLSKKWYRIYDCGCLCYEWTKSDLENKPQFGKIK